MPKSAQTHLFLSTANCFDRVQQESSFPACTTNALDGVIDPIESDSSLETIQKSLTDGMGTCSKKETHGRHCPRLADLVMPRTYSATSCVVVKVLFHVHSVSSTPATCTGFRKKVKGAHGVDGGQCLLMLNSTLNESPRNCSFKSCPTPRKRLCGALFSCKTCFDLHTFAVEHYTSTFWMHQKRLWKRLLWCTGP